MQLTSTKSLEECSQLNHRMSQCKDCTLHTEASRHVPGVFCNAEDTIDLMFIGEAPGASEDARGVPFVGRAGQLLQQTLQKLNITKNIYITNVIKHRPPNNRKPTQEEMITCGGKFLCTEILILRPKAIVCLGRSPAEYLMNLSGVPWVKGSLRGHQFSLDQHNGVPKEKPLWSCPVLCTWHPSFILRRRDKAPELEEDLLLAVEITSSKEKNECQL